MGEISIFPALSHVEKKFFLKFLDKFHSINKDEVDQGIYSIKKNEVNTNKPNKEALQENISNTFEDVISNIQTHILASHSMDEKLTPSLFSPFELCISSADETTECLSLKKKHSQKTESAKWLVFLIEHFFQKECIAKTIYPDEFNFLDTHTLNGAVWYKIGLDVKKIEVKDNIVTLFTLQVPEHLAKLQNGTIYDYKKYCKITIQELADNAQFSSKEVISLTKSNLLNKLILNAELNNNLKVNKVEKKAIKV